MINSHELFLGFFDLLRQLILEELLKDVVANLTRDSYKKSSRDSHRQFLQAFEQEYLPGFVSVELTMVKIHRNEKKKYQGVEERLEIVSSIYPCIYRKHPSGFLWEFPFGVPWGISQRIRCGILPETR